MIALAMAVLDVLGDRAPEMALAQRYDPIEAFLLDRPHEAFGGIRVRRLVRGGLRGGGYVVPGLYDVSPSLAGQINNLVIDSQQYREVVTCLTRARS